MPYEPIIPDGQHLGTSHDVDGAATGHLFEDGTNRLVGHAAWRWVDEPDFGTGDEDTSHPEPQRELTPEEIEAAIILAGVIVAGIIHVAAVATPHVQQWWKRRVVPAGRAVWGRLIARARKQKTPREPADFVERAMFVASTTGVEIAQPSNQIHMSSAEWEARFRSMLYAGAFAQEQMRVLSIARVDKLQTALEEPSASAELTAQQFVERVRLMLEAHPDLLNEETAAQLMKAFSTTGRTQNLPSTS
jgi:hypothetical protein